MKFKQQDKFTQANGTAINPGELLQPLLKDSVKRQVKAGDIIFYQGEAPRSACILKSGIVKVYNITSSGEEQLVNFQLPNEVFPTPWVFGKTPSVLYFYEALTDCELYLFPREEFLAYIKSDNKVLGIFLDYYVNNYIGAVMRITALEQPKAREKITYTMYYLVQRYGEHLTDDKVQIRIQLTHQHIANLVGLTRETTAVEMKKLKEAGVVHYVKQKYVVRVRKLLEMMGEDNFKDLNLS
jgi:CRP/FNR family transcriptional regulator, cyclic AMP receptor protein